MPKHKSITKDTLANKLLAKHPKFNAMYYKKYKLKLGTEQELASVRIARQINKDKLHGHTIERNEDTISIWDLRGNYSDVLKTSDHFTGDTNYPFIKLSVRRNRKDFGLLVEDIDYAIEVLQEVQAEIQKQID
tara:strand:+ start:82 stop:480 length:399 start_codon:yes stop_codon:yes gene_type:complete